MTASAAVSPPPIDSAPRLKPCRGHDVRRSVAALQPAGAVRLLDHLPDLTTDLDAGQTATARRALTVPSIQIGSGRLDASALETTPAICGTPFGLVAVDGLLAREVALGGRTFTSLYGPGDVFDLRTDAGSTLAAGATIVCPEIAVIAVLDDRLLAAMREWPRMIARLFAIAMRQLERADVNAAIGQLERVEDRLLGFFWLLADRWGRWGLDGIAIDQPLTHEAIGHLIGARRPTVSLGLRALSAQRMLARDRAGIWLLAPESLERVIGFTGAPVLAAD